MDESLRRRLVLPGEVLVEVLRFARCEDLDCAPLISRRFLTLIGHYKEELPARQVLCLAIDSKSMKLWRDAELIQTVSTKRRTSDHVLAFTSLYLDHYRDHIRSVKLNFTSATDNYVADLLAYFPSLRFVNDVFVSNNLSPYARFPTDNLLQMLGSTQCLTRMELESVPRWFDWTMLRLPMFRNLGRLCIYRQSSTEVSKLRNSEMDELHSFCFDFTTVDQKTVRIPCFRLSYKWHKKLVEALFQLGDKTLTVELGSSLHNDASGPNPYSTLRAIAQFDTDAGSTITRYLSKDETVLFIEDGDRFVGTNDPHMIEVLSDADQVPVV